MCADMDSPRTRAAHGQVADADAVKDWKRTWPSCGLDTAPDRTRTDRGCGYGRGADTDCFRTGRGRGLDTATAIMPAGGAGIPRPNRDHFADAESSF